MVYDSFRARVEDRTGDRWSVTGSLSFIESHAAAQGLTVLYVKPCKSAVNPTPTSTDPNEARADRGMRAVETLTDRNYAIDGADGLFTDLSDLMSDLRHLAARHGVDFDEAVDHSERAHAGDLEDGPEAKRRPVPRPTRDGLDG